MEGLMKAIGAFCVVCVGIAVIIGAAALYSAMQSIPKPQYDEPPVVHIRIDRDGKVIDVPYQPYQPYKPTPNYPKPDYPRPGSKDDSGSAEKKSE